MAQFKNMYKVELNNGIAPVVSLKQIYYADVEANRIGAIVTMNGQPFPLSGTCTGSAILADGSTVPMAGVIDGNQAYIDLDSSCYSVEGQIKIFVKITTGGVTTTLLAAVGTVQLTETDTVIDPGTIIPSVSALITAIEDAVESIPADYTALLETIAPLYANLTFPVKAGQWCWYSGVLYEANQDISTSENWTAAHWNTTTVGGAVSELKSAFTEISTKNIDNTNGWTVGTLKAADGTTSTSSSRLRMDSFVSVDDKVFGFKTKTGYDFLVYAWDKTSGNYIGCMHIGSVYGTSISDLLWLNEYYFDPTCKYKVVIRNADNPSATMTAAEASNCLYVVRSIDETLTVKGQAADAKKTGDEINALKESVFTVETSAIWSQGRWATANGNSSSSDVWIKTPKYIPTDYVKNALGVVPDSGYRLMVLGWKKSDDTYMGCWNGNAFTKSDTVTHETPIWFWEIGSDYKFAINLAKTGGSAIVPSEGTHVKFICTDASLKVAQNQGIENAGKVMVIGSDGNLSPEEYKSVVYEYAEPIPAPSWGLGTISSGGTLTNYKNTVRSSAFRVKKGDYITATNGLYLRGTLYNSSETSELTYVKTYAWTNSGRIDIDADGYARVQVSDAEHYNVSGSPLPNTDYQYRVYIHVQTTAIQTVDEIEQETEKGRTFGNKTGLFRAQEAVASDWHLPFINVYDALGLGNNHQIPGTKTTWDQSGTTDLTQKNVWMSDGTHPYRGVGLVDMYGRTIANQLALVSPSYHDGEGESSPSYWAGKRLLWMGTSIPAGSDPDAGSGTGATYPQMVATQLGATSVNIARGSSMLRVKSSTGLYNDIPFSHYIRAITRMVAECDEIAADWANIYEDIPNAPSELTAGNIATMKNHSFENLVVPYLDGTNTAPDLYVIDYGHNDYANGIDGKRDWWIQPTAENIKNGILAPDTYMTANNYANLKLALNDDLSGITDLYTFAASLNRNCFQGACNFLITVILRYKPYARIAIISDYN